MVVFRNVVQFNRKARNMDATNMIWNTTSPACSNCIAAESSPDMATYTNRNGVVITVL